MHTGDLAPDAHPTPRAPSESRPLAAPAIAAQCAMGRRAKALAAPMRALARRLLCPAVLATAALSLAILFALASWEAHTSRLQAWWFARLAQQMRFSPQSGKSPAIAFPAHGPYDQRAGYAGLAGRLLRLESQGYVIAAQARQMPALQAHINQGGFAPYREKSRMGLQVRGHLDGSWASFGFPRRQFERYEDIAPVALKILLFVENRRLLGELPNHHNPVIEPRRLAGALWEQAWAHDPKGRHGHAGGASTLATQIEKFRHSPGGATHSPAEKWRQMWSASLRAYRLGPDTRATRRELVLDYVNSVPLSAAPGWGEVHGLGEGLWVWFGTDHGALTATLAQALEPKPPQDPERLRAIARAARQILTLVLAQQQPSFYLPDNVGRLDRRVRAYASLMAEQGVLPHWLAQAIAGVDAPTAPAPAPVPEQPWHLEPAMRPAATRQLHRIMAQLGVEHQHELLAMDLGVDATTSAVIETRVRQKLERTLDQGIHDARTGRDLRGAGNPGDIAIAMQLFESTPHGHKRRLSVQTRELDVDINGGSMLDLGSTAKLRTLVSYLEAVDQTWGEMRVWAGPRLPEGPPLPEDPLTGWMRALLQEHPRLTRPEILARAMGRTYAASPRETFYTGGGPHEFKNFSATDDARYFSVAQALARSVNLPWVRIMRDVVDWHIARLPHRRAQVLIEPYDARRQGMLQYYAGVEARALLGRFHAFHRGRAPRASADLLLERLRRSSAPGVDRLDDAANIFHAAFPHGDALSMRAFLHPRGFAVPTDDAELLFALTRLVHAPTWVAQGLGSLHPLELWVVAWLARHDGEPSREAVLAASRQVMPGAVAWIRDHATPEEVERHIYYALEEEAFARILAQWQRLGYPFARLTPSYATALGASADRPESLARLVGIIAQGGTDKPVVDVERWHFAADTPYETALAPAAHGSKRVLDPLVAKVAGEALARVVQEGTGQSMERAYGHWLRRFGALGGKTGTGDNRFHVRDAQGEVVSRIARHRTATWAFHLGRCFHGTVVAYVDAEHAHSHTFTSSLALGALAAVEQELQPLLEASPCRTPLPGR